MKKINDGRFDGLSLLKRSVTVSPSGPGEAVLETFDNLYSGRDYEIVFECPEFTSLCPVTGQPDFGAIEIRYVPDMLCLESKSLKLFLFSFRNHETFHEEAVNEILDAVVEACRPRRAEVLGDFRPRGGIALKVKAAYQKNGEKKRGK
ncbi:MAG: NADPH-dependent 7-cyano-7-deazaguanine reductase QueF [Victivallales bacterium]|nr:NADPH-dependent 7-cyano-7-deazaguanine reductase QueF [Victivallales bacterium]